MTTGHCVKKQERDYIRRTGAVDTENGLMARGGNEDHRVAVATKSTVKKSTNTVAQ